MIKEIYISVYDSGYHWTILRIENNKMYKIDSFSEYKTLTKIEKLIYDSQLLFWRKDNLTKDVVIKKLTNLRYNKIVLCEEGCVEVYKNGKILFGEVGHEEN